MLYENELAWEIFADFSGQVRVGGMGGVIGFDYASLPFILSAHGVDEGYHYEYVKKFGVLNRVAVELWNKDDNKKQSANSKNRPPR